MFDRLFLPALTLTVLAAGLGAFAADYSYRTPVQIVRLERVVVVAQREQPAAPTAHAALAISDAQPTVVR